MHLNNCIDYYLEIVNLINFIDISKDTYIHNCRSILLPTLPHGTSKAPWRRWWSMSCAAARSACSCSKALCAAGVTAIRAVTLDSDAISSQCCVRSCAEAILGTGYG